MLKSVALMLAYRLGTLLVQSIKTTLFTIAGSLQITYRAV